MKPFELECEERWVKSLSAIEWSQSLDSSSRLIARFALPGKDRMELGLGSLPQSVVFKSLGKSLFKGSLHSVRTGGLNGVEIEFRDKVDLLSRTYESEFVKGQRLQDFLESVAGVVGLRAKFLGKLSQDLPGLDLGGHSYLEHLVKLGSDYGFHFVENAIAGELVFIGLGAHREKVTFDGTEQLAARAERTAEPLFQAAEVMGFDSQEGKASKQELSGSAIYEGLGFLKGASFETRARWAQGRGRMETVVAAGKSAEKHRESLTARLSKRAVGADTFTLTTPEWIGFPGDQAEVKRRHDKVSEGGYLVARVCTRVQSSRPVFETSLVRA